MVIRNLPLEKIKPDPNQPRQTIDKEKVSDMAKSILTEGVINPIEVDKRGIIITGEMRWRAAKLAKLKEIPCKILTIGKTERFRRQVIENIHHNTMTDWDTAVALHKLLISLPIEPGSIGKHGGKPTQGYVLLANLIGKSDRYVGEKIDILNSSPRFKEAVKQGLSGSFIRAIKKTPEQFKEQMEVKITRGDFLTRDDALSVATALTRSPEKAEEILKAKTISKVRELSPQRSDLIAQSFNRIEEFSRRVDLLVAWLQENPPHEVGNIHAMEIVLGFKVLLEAINSWQKPTLKG